MNSKGIFGKNKENIRASFEHFSERGDGKLNEGYILSTLIEDGRHQSKKISSLNQLTPVRFEVKKILSQNNKDDPSYNTNYMSSVGDILDSLTDIGDLPKEINDLNPNVFSTEEDLNNYKESYNNLISKHKELFKIMDKYGFFEEKEYGSNDGHSISIREYRFRDDIENDKLFKELLNFATKNRVESKKNQDTIQQYLTYEKFLSNEEVNNFFREYTDEPIQDDMRYSNIKQYYDYDSLYIDNKYIRDGGDINFFKGNIRDRIFTLLNAPSLKNKKDIENYIRYNNILSGFKLDEFKNKEVVAPSDISKMKNALSAFSAIKNSINWDANQSEWTIDKEEFKRKINNLDSFYQKMQSYVDSYDELLADPSNEQKKAEMLKQYNALISEDGDIFKKQQFGKEALSPKGQELLEKFNRIASESNDKAVAEMNEMIDKLKLFDRNHQIVREVNEKVAELTNNIQSKEREIAEKQAELNNINSSISNNALTEDERNANTLREEKERELAEKQREKEQLEQEKATKERELEELNRAIQNGNLTNRGLQNIGIGYNNFNSGAKSITIGNENTVLADGAVAMGNNNNLSKEATNTFVLGSNVTTNIPNSVALGKDTVLNTAVATPSHTIAGAVYNFAGSAPVGTVSIGAEGKERTLTNLAAGRISNTSTDGVNGSQLNAVIETLNSLNTELTTLKNAPKPKAPVIKAGDGLSLSEGEDGSITLSNALTFVNGNGVSVNKEGNKVTITNTQPLSDENKTKYDNASPKAETAVQPDKLKAGDGISVSKAENGDITIANTKKFEDADKEKLNTASTNANSALEKAKANEGAITTANGKITANEGNIATLTGKVETVTNTANEALGKANTAVQPDKLKAGNGISVSKADNGEITITNTHPLSDENKTKYDNASAKAETALQPESLVAGNGVSVNNAGGKVTITNTGVIEIQAGDGVGVQNNNGVVTINNTKPDLTFEGKEGISVDKQGNKVVISASGLAPKGTGVNNVEGANGISVTKEGDKFIITNTKPFEESDKETLNTASGKANTAVQPNDLTAGKGITINKGQNGINISTNITGGKGISVVESNNGLTINNLMEIKAGKGVKIDNDGNTYTISSTGSALPRFEIRGDDKVVHEVVGALNVVGDENIETATEGDKVTVKLKKDIDVNSVKSGDNTFGKGGLKVGNTLITAKGAYMGNQVVDGVADGEIAPNSKQAINGGQLAPVVERILDHERAITQLDGKIGYLDQRITRMDKKHNAGIAGVAAMVGIPQVMEAGGVVFGAGVGNHAGTNAVAVGASMASDNGRHMIKTSFSVNSQKQVTSSIGYGFKWK